ncbi:hypothetical protein [Methylobacterium radiodurans]|uniref:Uncharacterized protein n=1 Tax=Methylobacterium radiodurans TaxID=2202828 RepID=A0A2U8VLR3_9HYPH|nr:hypothetical protein [Methylobacterium radiodurans]AWN34418.1 hypothetical protein DK427_00550 [Methylobacterium radiodurans]
MATETGADASDDPAERLEVVNALLAEWAACSTEESAPLIERFEAMGYAVRGKSREEVAEVLRRPPERV